MSMGDDEGILAETATEELMAERRDEVTRIMLGMSVEEQEEEFARGWDYDPADRLEYPSMDDAVNNYADDGQYDDDPSPYSGTLSED